MLEGKGRIFEKDPITLNPNMTGSEFAAVVTTLPMADQQAITTMVRELLREELDEPAAVDRSESATGSGWPPTQDG